MLVDLKTCESHKIEITLNSCITICDAAIQSSVLLDLSTYNDVKVMPYVQILKKAGGTDSLGATVMF